MPLEYRESLSSMNFAVKSASLYVVAGEVNESQANDKPDAETFLAF